MEKRGSQCYGRLRGFLVEHLVYVPMLRHWSRDSLTAKQLLMKLQKRKCNPSAKPTAGAMPQDTPYLGLTQIVASIVAVCISSS